MEYKLEQFLCLLKIVAQLVKNVPTMPETWVRSLDWKILWRREMLPTRVFWPGEFHGLYSPWGLKELDTTDFHFTSLQDFMQFYSDFPEGMLNMLKIVFCDYHIVSIMWYVKGEDRYVCVVYVYKCVWMCVTNIHT